MTKKLNKYIVRQETNSMEPILSMEFLMSIDGVLALVSGAIIGLLAGQFIQGWGFGTVGNSVIGLVGGLAGGFVFNWLDFLNVGDYADPIIAGVVGAIVLLGIIGAFRR
jgi:uncharacterized membrane protein YeaQ/YmgE (transglycosylase-associated protein family)